MKFYFFKGNNKHKVDHQTIKLQTVKLKIILYEF